MLRLPEDGEKEQVPVVRFQKFPRPEITPEDIRAVLAEVKTWKVKYRPAIDSRPIKAVSKASRKKDKSIFSKMLQESP